MQVELAFTSGDDIPISHPFPTKITIAPKKPIMI